jgi:hypothetical protein
MPVNVGKPTKGWSFPSSSSDVVYEVLQWPDGSYSCNCPAWRFVKAGKPRTCKHLKMAGAPPEAAAAAPSPPSTKATGPPDPPKTPPPVKKVPDTMPSAGELRKALKRGRLGQVEF